MGETSTQEELGHVAAGLGGGWLSDPVSATRWNPHRKHGREHNGKL